MTEKQRSAVLLDRHPLWLEAVEFVLTRLDVVVVGKATMPRRALELVESKRPDLFVTGVKMDGPMDGIECLRRAKSVVPGLEAIVLSMDASTARIDAALEAGAFAYVIKSAHPDDLASAIRQTFEHSVFLSRGPTDVAGLRLAETPPQPAADASPPLLTRREAEILQLMVEGHSNAQLAKMLWVTEQTVKFHLSNVYRKLGAANRTEATRYAHLHGLVAGRARPPIVAAG